MRTNSLVSALVLAGALSAGGALAQVPESLPLPLGGGGGLGRGGFAPGGLGQSSLGAPSPRQLELYHLQQEYLTLRRQQSDLEAKLREVRATHVDGAPQVVAAMKALDANQEAFALVKHRLEEEAERSQRDYRRGAILLTRVSIDLQNATVRQAAEALGKATRVAIQVDEQVPENLRLSVAARGITLGAVLEAVARQANLKVAPAEGGAVITTWPMVEVNGQHQVFKGRWAPWATEWGQLPGSLSPSGWSFPGEPGGAASANDANAAVGFAPPIAGGAPMPGPAPVGLAGGYSGSSTDPDVTPGLPGSPSTGRSAPRERSTVTSGAEAAASSLTSLGERQIALAEPGRNPAGQPGVWISIYRLEGTQLKKIAATFHVLRTESSGVTMPIPGIPGMGGRAPGAGGAPLVPGTAPGTRGLGGPPLGIGGGLPSTPGFTRAPRKSRPAPRK